MITKQQVIDEAAIKAPYELGEGFIFAAQNAEKLITQMKSIGTSGGSPSKLAKETNELTAAQAELEKIQKQLVIAQAKQNEEVIKAQKELIKERDAIKQKTALGERDAKAVKAQTASIQELQAALNANRKAYASLRSEEERNSKTGKELLSIIQEQDQGIKDLKASMGQHQDQVGNYEGAIKGLKTELKLARDEMAGIAATLGNESPEFLAAAKRAGALKDQISDINDAVKNTEQSGLENVAKSLGDVTDKIRAGDLGGAAVAAKQFAANLSSVSFKELSAGVSSFGSAIATVGRAILTNPIFLIAAAVSAAVVAFNYFSSEAEKATQRMLARSQREIDKLTERYDHEIRLMEIAGKKTFELERAKQKLIISTAEEAIKNSGDVTKFDLLQSIAQRRIAFTVSEEKLKQLKEFYDAKKRAQMDLEIIDAEEAAFTKKQAEETTKKLSDELKKRNEEAKKAAEEARESQLEMQRFNLATQEELRKLAIEDQKKANEEELRLLQERIDNEANRIKQAVIDKNITREEGEKQLAAFLKSQGDEIINQQIAGLQKLLALDTLNFEERAAIEKQLYALKNNLVDAYYSQVESKQKTSLEKQLEENTKFLTKVRDIYASAGGSITDIFAGITERRIQDIDAEMAKIEEATAREIELAGNNEAAKSEIEARAEEKRKVLEAKKRAEQQRVARADKAFALVGAAINTALSITKTLATLGVPAGIPAAALAGVLGALQIAAIAAKPIPQFEVGTRNAPGGLAVVGEAGRELIQTPSGRLSLTPSSATLVDIPKGSKVFTNDETLSMLARAGIGETNFSNGITMGQLIAQMEKNNKANADRIVSAASKKENFVKKGSLLYKVIEDQGRNTKLIRQSVTR